MSSQTDTHTNVVLGSVGTKPEVNDHKHVLYGKHRDLVRVKHGGKSLAVRRSLGEPV